MHLFINNDHLNIQPIDASNYNYILYFKDGAQCHYSIDKEGKITFVGITNGSCISINKTNLNPLPFKTIQEWNCAIESNHATKAKINELYSHCRTFNVRDIYNKRVNRIFGALAIIIFLIINYGFMTDFFYETVNPERFWNVLKYYWYVSVSIGFLLLLIPLTVLILKACEKTLEYFWEGK